MAHATLSHRSPRVVINLKAPCTCIYLTHLKFWQPSIFCTYKCG
ncbi:hypothetical protein B566_EDAN009796 [Ephemera danica]|nr:hypothetical protein B566_EDAN009796 [Ephemera danica]